MDFLVGLQWYPFQAWKLGFLLVFTLIHSKVKSKTSKIVKKQGPMTYALFTAAGMWAFSLGCAPRGWDLSIEARIWASRLGFEPQNWDLSLETWIWALRLGFEPLILDLSLEIGIKALRLGYEPQDWDLSLETGIWASKMGFEPRDQVSSGGGGCYTGDEGELSPYVKAWVIGRCPKRKTFRSWSRRVRIFLSFVFSGQSLKSG